jgi:rare lipoprotein A
MVVPAPPAASAQGFYLQLGAYAQAVNADAARARLAQHPAAALAPMEVVEYEKLFRVYSGPFATRAEAAAAALRLQDGGLAKPMIVQR